MLSYNAPDLSVTTVASRLLLMNVLLVMELLFKLDFKRILY